MMSHSSPLWEMQKRVGMAWLISRYPQTFDVIRKEEISFFHGTNSTALPQILTKGLNSLDKIRRDGGKITSGEEWSENYRSGDDNTVSITDDMDTAIDYSAFAPKGEAKGQPSYGVLIGIKASALKKLKTKVMGSDCVELGIADGIPVELISFIGVPQDKIDDVKKMIGPYKDISIMPFDSKEKFYMIEKANVLSLDLEKADRVYNGKSEPQKSFGAEAYKKLSHTRVLGKLLESMKKLKHNTTKTKEDKKKTSYEIGE